LIDDERRGTYFKKIKNCIAKKINGARNLQLWVEKKSIDEIATIRVLTKQTIYSHFVKLIQTKAVAISEVLPADKMQDLAAAFGGTAKNHSMG
jgi:uncharacterized protein YpbB